MRRYLSRQSGKRLVRGGGTDVARRIERDETSLPRLAISPKQAAEMLGVSRDFVYSLIADRLVVSAKAGGRVLVDLQSVYDYYESIKRD
jgi:excisionase family DNA binding protein